MITKDQVIIEMMAAAVWPNSEDHLIQQGAKMAYDIIVQHNLHSEEGTLSSEKQSVPPVL